MLFVAGETVSDSRRDDESMLGIGCVVASRNQDRRACRCKKLMTSRSVRVVSSLFHFILFVMLIGQLPGAINGSLSGFATDEQSNPMAGVVVISAYAGTSGLIQETVTDQAGFYQFTFLPPEKYDVRFHIDGHKTRLVKGIAVRETMVARLDVVLVQGDTGEVVETRAEEWLVEPGRSGFGSFFTRETMGILPMARNIWVLLENLDPATVTNRIDIGGIKSEIPALFGTNGSSWTQNEYRLNGINVTDPFETGKPLFYPAYHTIRELQVSTASHSANTAVPGSSLNIVTHEGGNQWHGTVQGFYQGRATQGNNLDQDLREEGVTSSERFRSYFSGEANLGGPLLSEKVFLFSSFFKQHFSKEVPGFSRKVDSEVISGLTHVTYERDRREQFRFLWTRQKVENNHLGANFRTEPSATLDLEDDFDILQTRWERLFGASTVISGHFGFSRGTLDRHFQRGFATERSRTDLFTEFRSGLAPLAIESERNRFSAGFGLNYLKGNWLRGSHRFHLGWRWNLGTVSSRYGVFEDLNLQFLPDDFHPYKKSETRPFSVVQFNTPVHPRESVRDHSAFFQDQINFRGSIALRLGLRLGSTRGWLPEQSSPAGSFSAARDFPKVENLIKWNTLEPRLGLAFPLFKGTGTLIRVGFAGYFHGLPANYLDFQNPNSLSARVFSWNDLNQDRDFQAREQGQLLRVLGGEFASIDRDLKRPYTREFTIGIEPSLSNKFKASIVLIRRDQVDLLETVNTGVPFSAYTPVEITDPGGDGIFGTPDDQSLTVFNQRRETLGQDRYLLTNPEGFAAVHRGLQVVVAKSFPERWHFYFAFSAYESKSPATPGNSEFENDPGVVGSLFDSPNTLINTHNRYFFDRAFTGRIAGFYETPWGIRLSAITKYYDGRPFGRKLVLSGFNQGAFFIHATPRGNPIGHRTEFNLNVDLRIEKGFAFRGKQSLSLLLDVFNLLNANKKTHENELTGPFFSERIALEFQSPRVLRLGLRYDF